MRKILSLLLLSALASGCADMATNKMSSDGMMTEDKKMGSMDYKSMDKDDMKKSMGHDSMMEDKKMDAMDKDGMKQSMDHDSMM